MIFITTKSYCQNGKVEHINYKKLFTESFAEREYYRVNLENCESQLAQCNLSDSTKSVLLNVYKIKLSDFTIRHNQLFNEYVDKENQLKKVNKQKKKLILFNGSLSAIITYFIYINIKKL